MHEIISHFISSKVLFTPPEVPFPLHYSYITLYPRVRGESYRTIQITLIARDSKRPLSVVQGQKKKCLRVCALVGTKHSCQSLQ
jgi:hypothetical protein